MDDGRSVCGVCGTVYFADGFGPCSVRGCSGSVARAPMLRCSSCSTTLSALLGRAGDPCGLPLAGGRFCDGVLSPFPPTIEADGPRWEPEHDPGRVVRVGDVLKLAEWREGKRVAKILGGEAVFDDGSGAWLNVPTGTLANAQWLFCNPPTLGLRDRPAGQVAALVCSAAAQFGERFDWDALGEILLRATDEELEALFAAAKRKRGSRGA